MIEVAASLNGYGTDRAEADDPEAALAAATTLAADIREATGSGELIACEFFVAGTRIRRVWL